MPTNEIYGNINLKIIMVPRFLCALFVLLLAYVTIAIRTRSRDYSKSSRSSIPTLRFNCKNMPTICSSIRNAMDEGHSQVLHRTRSSASGNRRAACGGVLAGVGMSCDEYPFASTKEGGKRARTRVVPLSENHSQGGQLSAFYRKYGIGTSGRNSRFRVERPRG